MFNLEQSIEEWRRQMLAAGIKAPVPLEELESHLREEIEAQVHSGKNEQQAFEATVLHMGQGRELQTEFSKEWEWRDLLPSNLSKRQKLILFCWIGYCLVELTCAFEDHLHSAATSLTNALLIISLAIIAIATYMAGIFWSRLLVKSTKRMRSVIEVIVTLGNLLILIPMILSLTRPSFREWVHMLFIPFYFNLMTGVFLQPRLPAEPENVAK